MKLNAFFTKPKPTGDLSTKAMVDNIQNPATANIQLAPDTTLTSTNSAPPSPQKAILKNATTDYEKFFLPFSLPPHATLAPINAFIVDADVLAAAQKRMDRLTSHEDVDTEPVTLETVRSLFPKRRRGIETPTIAEIVDLVNGSADRPIDLTEDGNSKPTQPLALLSRIPMKYLHFPEDVRPPYHGTYTKLHTRSEERKLARNPTCRGFSDLNYDYDSEAEWEEPEEGEDLDSEGDDDLDEDGDEEMDGFLDDDEDPQLKRRLHNGDQEPVSTGLCWEDSRGVSRLNDGSGAISTEFKNFRMGFLLGMYLQTLSTSIVLTL
jgi:chromatin assembly factor 1 subunit A